MPRGDLAAAVYRVLPFHGYQGRCPRRSRPTATPSTTATSPRRWTTSTRAARTGSGAGWRTPSKDVDVQDLRASVFAGPVFGPADRLYRGVALPSEYWKLLLFREQGVVKARAFVLTQDLDQLRAVLALDEFRVYQITMAELESRTLLHFPQAVHEAGTLPAVRAMSERKPLAVTSDIFW
jgi:hypothetical protein